MPRKAGLLTLLLAACFALGSEHRGTTTLSLRVDPEARLDPQHIPLTFRVSSDGASDVTTQTASMAAKVRALPGQQIHVTARLTSLNGPAGAVAAGALRWSGAVAEATAGGQPAACSSGTFQAGAAGDLVTGWQQSGSVACSLSFQLATRNLEPGAYSGEVDLALDVR